VNGDDRFHLLVLAGAKVEGADLREGIMGRHPDHEVDVYLVAPALTATPLRHAMGDVDDAIASARRRLERSVEEIKRAGIPVSGAVGDADPELAIQDALQVFPADEIVIATHPDEEATWLEKEAFERAQRTFSQPISHLVIDERDGGHTATEVEAKGEGPADEPSEKEIGYSENMPPLSVRDLAGIGIAILGTIVLAVLAASCDYGEDLTAGFGGCTARFLLAVGAGLISLAHVVGLVLFESVRYHGLWERFVAKAVLLGMPIAIVVSLLLG
jgi:hypothetical protein